MKHADAIDTLLREARLLATQARDIERGQADTSEEKTRNQQRSIAAHAQSLRLQASARALATLEEAP